MLNKYLALAMGALVTLTVSSGASAQAASPAPSSASPQLQSASYDVARVLPSGRVVLAASGLDLAQAEAKASGIKPMSGTVAISEREPLLLSDHTNEQWALPKIGMNSQTRGLASGAGTTVAVIDTGVAAHPDLPRVLAGIDLSGQDGSDGHYDDFGHGTHVAGIIAASIADDYGIDGIAPDATVLPVKVLDRDGWGTDAGVAAGISWAADHGADIINMSLGGEEGSDELVSAIRYARGKGVTIVAAAGNDGTDYPMYPAAYPGVISVSATDSSDGIAWFSNFGTTIDVAAPGVDVLSTLPGPTWKSWSGTSMATPHVAALAALVAGQHPDWSPDQIENQIEASATDLGDAGKDERYGHGRINATAAVTSPELPPVQKPTEPSAPTWASLDMPYQVNAADKTFPVAVASDREQVTLECTFGGTQETIQTPSDTPVSMDATRGRVKCAAYDDSGEVLDSGSTKVSVGTRSVNFSRSATRIQVSGEANNSASLRLDRWSDAKARWVAVKRVNAGADWTKFTLTSSRLRSSARYRFRPLGSGYFSSGETVYFTAPAARGRKMHHKPRKRATSNSASQFVR